MDKIVDIRVLMPADTNMRHVHVVLEPCHGVRQDLHTISYTGVPPEKPTFEVSKSYRTAGDHIMRVNRVGVGDDRDDIVAEQIDGDPFKRVILVYHPNGIAKGQDWDAYQLLPGAIADEPTPESTIDRPALQLDAIQAQLTDLFRQMRGVRSNLADVAAGADTRINNLEKHCEAMQARIEDHTARDVELYRRIAQLTEAVTQLQAEAITRNERELNAAHEAMVDKSGAYSDYERRIKTHPGNGVSPPKPTIKGGWVNVYWNKHRKIAMVGELYPTQAEAGADGTGARARIACIQIPDIQEGEGL